jgi:uncharacterized delta-60 repeat protein
MKRIYFAALFIVINSIYTAGQSIDPSFNTPLFSSTSRITATLRLPGDKLLIAGEFVTIGTTPRAGKLVLLKSDGTIDNSFNPGKGLTSGIVSAMATQSDGKIIVVGSIDEYNGTAVNDIMRLNPDGSLDTGFNTGAGAAIAQPFFSLIHSIAVQNDDKILVAGVFTSFNGIARKNVVRLNSDGSVDQSFNPVLTFTETGTVPRPKLWIQPNGKILISGGITSVNGTATSSVVRLNSDGTLDTDFTTAMGTGFDGLVLQLAIQSDGKILAHGDFTSANGVNFNKLARLNADGSVDATFPANLGFNNGNSLTTLLVLADDSFIVAGNFQSPKARIMKLSANGVIDNTFNVGSGITATLSAEFPDVLSLAVQSDGKIIAAGSFSRYNGQQCISLIRLDANGSIDTNYKPNPGGVAEITGILPTDDGKVYIGGNFLYVNGVETPIGLVRLNADGTRDTGFNISNIDLTNTYASCKTIALDNNGKLLVGGEFRIFNTNFYYGLARFNTDGSFDATWTGFTGLQTAYTTDGVFEIKHLADGKIIIGGAFTKVNGTDIAHFARLNADGTLDTQFNSANSFADLQTTNFQVRPTDGKMILAQFPRGGAWAPRVSLVNPDGSRDNTLDINSKFNKSLVGKAIFTNSGKILVGGDFTEYDGNPANKLVRINDMGVRDAAFEADDAMTGYVVKELVPLSSGITLVGKSRDFNTQVTASASYLDVVDDKGKTISADFQINGDVLKIAVTSSYIYLGGRITAAGATPAFSLVRLTNPAAPAASPTALATSTESGPRRNVLTWTDNSTTEAGFEIQRSSPTNSNFARIGTAPANATTFTDASGLNPGIQYYYRVKAVNINGESGYSNESSVTTLPDAPAAPTDLLVSPVSGTEMKITWSDNSTNETGFEIFRSQANNTSFAKIATTAANATSFMDTGLQPEVSYFYKVRAINAGGVSAFTSEGSNLILGVPEHSRKLIVVYPNPVTTDLVLENPTPEAAAVECFNLVGGKVLAGEKISPDSSLGVNTSGWPSGVYFVSVQFPDRVETHKIFKF